MLQEPLPVVANSHGQSAPVGRVHHYTGQAGLEGIIRTGSLFASDATFLNDASELGFGSERLSAALRRRADDLESVHGPLSVGSEMANKVRLMRSAARSLEPGEMLAPAHPRGIYITCFSADDDSLSQWRGYGGQGSGYCLTFDLEAMRGVEQMNVGPRFNYGSSSRRIRYRSPNLVHYGADCDEIIRDVVDFAEALPAQGHPGALGYGFAFTEGLRAVSLMKDEAFADEKELRLVVHESSEALVPTERLLFRPGDRWLIPYLLVAFPRPALRAVRVGPGRDTTIRAAACRQLLDRYGFKDAEVTTSGAPFRG